MSEGTEETKKGGFFGKLMKIAFIAAIVGGRGRLQASARQGSGRGRVAGAAAPCGRVAEPDTSARGPRSSRALRVWPRVPLRCRFRGDG